MASLTNPNSTSFQETLTKSIGDEIQRRINEALDQEIKAAQDRVERTIRDQVGQIAANVLQNFSMETLGPELIIRVRFDRKP
jgi:F0F1-type ATP synthase membrane subunit b/b'